MLMVPGANLSVSLASVSSASFYLVSVYFVLKMAPPDLNQTLMKMTLSHSLESTRVEKAA